MNNKNYEIIVGTKLDLGFDMEVIDSVLVYDPLIKTNVVITPQDSFNCDPDGALWLLPKNLLNDFKEYYYDYFKNNVKSFNFTNGPYAESFAVLNMYEDKYLIIFLDPECGTGIFEDIVTDFSIKHDIDELYGEECHIISKLSDDKRDDNLPEIFNEVILLDKVFYKKYYYIFNNIICKENDRIKYTMETTLYTKKNRYIISNKRFCGQNTTWVFETLEEVNEHLKSCKYLDIIDEDSYNEWKETGIKPKEKE